MKQMRPAHLLVAAVLAAFVLLLVALSIVAATTPDAVTRAVLGMGIGLALVWAGLGGALQWTLRPRMTRWVQAAPGHWMLKFVLFATLLALLEEAVAISMTHAAPFFGVPYGTAYITATGNYLDLIALHSVVVFVPMFLAWAFLLRYLAFSPAAVFLLFGLNGTTGELFFGGTQALLQAPMWIFVYGLMIWLPACSVPPERGAIAMRWWHVPIALVLPILAAMPVALLISWLHPIPIHFPPLAAGG